jgi:hypothetical protein
MAATPVGRPSHTWADVETALQGWMRTSGSLETASAEAEAEVERGERALLARLLEKYPAAHPVNSTTASLVHGLDLPAQTDLMSEFVGAAPPAELDAAGFRKEFTVMVPYRRVKCNMNGYEPRHCCRQPNCRARSAIRTSGK